MNFKKYQNEMQKYAKNVARNYDDYISSVLHANFEKNEHIMLVGEEKIFTEVYDLVNEELSPLEKVDLIDYQKIRRKWKNR